MSEKGRGAKIVIQFSDTIKKEPTPITVESIIGTWTALGTCSDPNSKVSNVYDGSFDTNWATQTSSNYIQVVDPGMRLEGFKIYRHPSYPFSSYTISTSVDGVTFTEIQTGAFATTAGWQNVLLITPVVTNYVRIRFSGMSYFGMIPELRLLVTGWDGILDITWLERLHVGGVTLPQKGRIASIVRNPENAKQLIVTMREVMGRFHNAEGDITLTYDKNKGGWLGRGGPVESFVRTFAPVDLEMVPNPYQAEQITTGITFPVVALTKVYHRPAFAEENLAASITPSMVVTKTGNNPL